MDAVRTANVQDDSSVDQAGQRFLLFVRTGDDSVLEELLAEHIDRCYSQARHLLRNLSEAEDAVQEALFKLVHTKSRFNGSIPFAAWLGRLVHHAAIDALRKRGRRRRREREGKDSELHSTPARRPEDGDAELVRSVVMELPEQYRATVDLHYFAGLSQRDTAKALGMKENTVAVRLHRAREYLRSLLQSRGVAITGASIAIALESAPVEAAPPTLLATAFAAVSGNSAISGSFAMAATAASWSKSAAIAMAVLVALGGGAYVATRPATPFSRTWEFATPDLPTEFRLVRGSLTWEPGPDNSGCFVAGNDCVFTIDAPPGPLVLTLAAQDITVDLFGLPDFTATRSESDHFGGSLPWVIEEAPGKTPSWQKLEVYLGAYGSDIWQNRRRIHLIPVDGGRGAVRVSWKGRFRIDRLELHQIRADQLPADGTAFLAAAHDRYQ